nr:hypothetical protein [Klebsiella pneumoniae]HBY1234685.1 hypothetical protein [Klebsiella pneumoniae]
MFLKYAYRPVLTTDTRKNQYARAFYQVYSGVLAKDIKSHFLNNKLFHIGGVSGNPRKFRHSALWNFLGGWSAA